MDYSTARKPSEGANEVQEKTQTDIIEARNRHRQDAIDALAFQKKMNKVKRKAIANRNEEIK